MESIEIILSQYMENCELLIYYPTIGGEYKKGHVKKAIINLLHSNIDVHSRMLIDKFIGYGVKCASKVQYICANMTFF